MSKPKDIIPRRSTVVRIPIPLYERLLKLAGDRQSKERRPISVNSLIVEALQQSLN